MLAAASRRLSWVNLAEHLGAELVQVHLERLEVEPRGLPVLVAAQSQCRIHTIKDREVETRR